jgi:hypothetical protein
LAALALASTAGCYVGAGPIAGWGSRNGMFIGLEGSGGSVVGAAASNTYRVRDWKGRFHGLFDFEIPEAYGFMNTRIQIGGVSGEGGGSEIAVGQGVIVLAWTHACASDGYAGEVSFWFRVVGNEWQLALAARGMWFVRSVVCTD